MSFNSKKVLSLISRLTAVNRQKVSVVLVVLVVLVMVVVVVLFLR